MFCSRTWLFGAALFVWLCCSCMLNGADGQNITDPTEVTALGAIRSSLIDPNGNLSDWNRGDPCTSNWTGVLCYNTTMRDGYLHVRELYDFSLFLIFVPLSDHHEHDFCEPRLRWK
ncbi:hypothetical protein CsSME_00041334 [Camellia sinensis var. sinensis]